MSRRSKPQKEVDLQAFPVKVFLNGLKGGFQLALPPGKDPHRWMKEHMGLGNMELYGAQSVYLGEGYVLLARTLEHVAKFLAAFPEFEIGDGTVSPMYNSPYVSQGQRRQRHGGAQSVAAHVDMTKVVGG